MAKAAPASGKSEGLDAYHRRRDFSRTSEPWGAVAAAGATARFVVQMHAARRLHYDLRLELGGTFKSWAVTRGPSLDPADKRLAVEVEDHPLDYGDFEGTIPQGQYGGGTVMIWDRGIWRPDGDAAADLDSGKLGFTLQGKKLRGSWALVRMRTRERRVNWLLIKHEDRYARPGSGDELTARPARSVASRRTLEGIAAAAEERRRVEPAATGLVQADPPEPAPTQPAKGSPAKAAAFPAFVEPQLATLVERAPSGAGWLHEVKLDGYRLQCRIEGRQVQLLTRNGLDWTKRFPSIAKAAAKLPTKGAILDGEAVVLTADGHTSFGALQAALEGGRAEGELCYFVFDLLYRDGEDLRDLPLTERKARLRGLVDRTGAVIRYVDHVEAAGDAVLKAACSIALEGVISKRRDAPYRSGRGRGWLKSKCIEREELAVVGYTTEAGNAARIGALVLAARRDGQLAYAGRVGTGIDDRDGRLRRRLDELRRERAAVGGVPAPQRRGVRWVEPELVVEVELRGWTAEGRVRQASFVGLREDKMPSEVPREPAPRPAARKGPSGPIEIAGVRLTHPDKLLWPEEGVTKRGLAEYFAAVAPHLLRHAGGRPLSIVRCPEGRQGACFFQKHSGQGVTGPVRVAQLPEKGTTADYLFVDSAAGLVALAQLGALELHPWGAMIERGEEPDRLILDLDPDTSLAWPSVVAAAYEAKERLAGLKLRSFVKTTGGKGLHVVVPLRAATWPELRVFAKALAQAMVKDTPDRYIASASKAARGGKIFVDWLRNQRGATAVAAYSPRARAGATVATPLAWDELGDDLDPGRFTLTSVPERLASDHGDPWAELDRARQKISARARASLGIKA